MSVVIKDNTQTIKLTLNQRSAVFLRFMADELTDTSEPNTPKAKGNLRRDIVKEVVGLSAKVKWGKNYAIFQERKQYENYTTPGTGPHFAEDAAKSLPDKTAEVAKKVALI